MQSKSKQEKLAHKERKAKQKVLVMERESTPTSELQLSDQAQTESAIDTVHDNEDEKAVSVMEDTEDAMVTETDRKSGKIRFQRNVPGKPTIWEGEVIGKLQNVKKTKKGMINFHNWEMTRQAVLLCPSAKQGLMPMRKELKFIFPRAVWGVDVHGGFIEVARKLGLKPHRKPPFYIPYLEPEEQYAFIQKQIDKYNEVRGEQKKKMF